MRAKAVLDIDHFGHMTGDDAVLQAEIVALFRAQAELWSRLLVVDAPVQTWRDAAHSAKGSARGLGLWKLAEVCAKAEQLGRDGSVDGREIAAGLAAVREALREALDALPRFDAAND